MPRRLALKRFPPTRIQVGALLLAFEFRAIAAITAGFAVAFVVAVPAGILTALALGSLELDFQYVRWATSSSKYGATPSLCELAPGQPC
jgi:hypothetical protein